MLCKPRGVSVKPSARKLAAAASRSRTAITAWSMASCSGKRLEEALRRLVADHPQSRDFLPLGVEEDDAWRSVERKALQQLTVRGARRGEIRLQQQHGRELRADPCVR